MAFQPRTTSLACACALFIRIEFKFDAWNPSINSTVLSCSLSLSKSLDAYVCHCQRINFNGIWSDLVGELNQYSGYIIFGGKVFDLIRFEMRNRNAKTAEIRIIWANYHMNGSSCCCCCWLFCSGTWDPHSNWRLSMARFICLFWPESIILGPCLSIKYSKHKTYTPITTVSTKIRRKKELY